MAHAACRPSPSVNCDCGVQAKNCESKTNNGRPFYACRDGTCKFSEWADSAIVLQLQRPVANEYTVSLKLKANNGQHTVSNAAVNAQKMLPLLSSSSFGVTTIIENLHIFVYSRFSAEWVALLKENAAGRAWDPARGAWKVPLRGAPDLVAIFDALYHPVAQELRDIAQNQQLGTGEFDVNMYVGLAGPNVALRFEFVPELVRIIKQLHPLHRRYEGTSRNWIVWLEALPCLLKLLEDDGSVISCSRPAELAGPQLALLVQAQYCQYQPPPAHQYYQYQPPPTHHYYDAPPLALPGRTSQPASQYYSDTESDDRHKRERAHDGREHKTARHAINYDSEESDDRRRRVHSQDGREQRARHDINYDSEE
eukprot:7284925-Pyramimonas_sp.AAC.1